MVEIVDLRIDVGTNFHLIPQFPEVTALPEPPIEEDHLQYAKQLPAGGLAQDPFRPHPVSIIRHPSENPRYAAPLPHVKIDSPEDENPFRC